MSAELTHLTLTLSQNQEQRVLRVVEVTYAYSLHNRSEAGTKDPGTPFWCTVDILGEDIFTDDLLAVNIDAHSTHCEPDTTERVERCFIVAQGVLDEDIGDDEIKLRLRVGRTDPRADPLTDQKTPTPNVAEQTPAITAVTPMVRGKF
jgi:hypothetical protein